MKKLGEVLLAFLAICVFSFIMGLGLVNWALGCGESFPQADGSRVQGECVSIKDIFSTRRDYE